jgi:transcriptional regulator with XRE-family HTH domain
VQVAGATGAAGAAEATGSVGSLGAEPGPRPGHLGAPLGDLLWQWRERRGLSLGQLAHAAGVSKSALSRWEAGTFQPRIAELEATLAALGVSAAESALAFAGIPAPRAVRHLSSDLSAATSSPLTKGDLLRALRLRKGWTLVQLAQQIGVSHQAVARWERLERRPSEEQIQALCLALGAREAEVIALTTESLADPAAWEAGTWQEAEQEIASLLLDGDVPHDQPDLPYYRLDETLWRWSLRQKEARSWLLRLRLYHAHEHRRFQRWELVDQMLSKAREVMPEPEMSLEWRLRHAILSARLAVYGGHRAAPERGVRLLQPLVEASRTLPAYQAWILADMAKYAALLGSFDSAVLLSEQACQAAERTEHWLELWLRRCDLGALLVQAGRAGEALSVIPDPQASEWESVLRDARPADLHVQATLSWAEAQDAIGELSAAQAALSKVQAMLKTIGIPEDQQRADALAARLQSR